MTNYFNNIDKVRYESPDSTNPFAYKYYDANQVILGKTMAEHLRLAVCYWHTFCWNGTDMFGLGSLDRSWQKNAGTLEAAKQKADIAFEFFTKLGVPYYCFHDVDVAPEGNSIKDYIHNFNTTGGNRREIAMGYGKLFQPSALYVRRLYQPESGSIRLGGNAGISRYECY